MEMTIFERSVEIKASPEEVFQLHLHPANLARLMSPFIRSEIVAPYSPSRVGDTVTIVIRLPFIALKWEAAITRVSEGLLEDVQVSGPFQSWRHEHRVEDIGGGRARLTDRVEFRFLPRALGQLDHRLVKPLLALAFAHRHRKMVPLFQVPRHLAPEPHGHLAGPTELR
jgi:ligand-binding SRPBCC domain-containing protein